MIDNASCKIFFIKSKPSKETFLNFLWSGTEINVCRIDKNATNRERKIYNPNLFC